MDNKPHNLLEKIEGAVHSVSSHKLNHPVAGREAYRSFKARANSQRKYWQKFADFVTNKTGTFGFLTINVLFFITWILWNTDKLPGATPFDPFPFVMLTTIVSLEAIILAIFVLMSQGREADITDLREEVDFQVNIQSEQEITKALQMLKEIKDHLGISNGKDSELDDMSKKLDSDKLQEQIEKEVHS